MLIAQPIIYVLLRGTEDTYYGFVPFHCKDFPSHWYLVRAGLFCSLVVQSKVDNVANVDIVDYVDSVSSPH